MNKEEFLKTKPDSRDILLWNENERNKQCSKEEFLKAKPSSWNIYRWNKNERNEKI